MNEYVLFLVWLNLCVRGFISFGDTTGTVRPLVLSIKNVKYYLALACTLISPLPLSPILIIPKSRTTATGNPQELNREKTLRMLCFNVLPAWFKSYNITFKVNKMQKVCMQGLQNIGLYNYWAYIKNVWNPMHVVFGCSSLRTGNGWVVNVMMYCTQTQSNVIRLYHTLVTTISTSD